MGRDSFTTAQWIGWIGATVAAGLTLSAFAFTTFETKEESRIKKAEIIDELHRMSDKIDRLLEQENRGAHGS